ncbi:Protein O-mannosyl-transferase 2 [Geodia barretti]|uniref:Protein O-mannosyl-transferase 2 n=1 Tax=Geodia barretti TaxID=519541 RepID=A0AA35R3Y6_GEOBA|nr:Protein O-mannosyl-transferase 2 [Geodia barretti]
MELRRRLEGSQPVSRHVLHSPEEPPVRSRAVLQRRVFRSPLDCSERWYWTGLAVVTLASALTRFYSITEPRHVAWDETHFGKHASWYIQGQFFFDVHPPLGKLVIAIAGVLTGYNGSFEFKEPGQKYDDTPYIGMRVVCALMGLLLVPLCYLTVWELATTCTNIPLSEKPGRWFSPSTFCWTSTAVLYNGRYLLHCTLHQLQTTCHLMLEWWYWFDTSRDVQWMFLLSVRGEPRAPLGSIPYHRPLSTCSGCLTDRARTSGTDLDGDLRLSVSGMFTWDSPLCSVPPLSSLSTLRCGLWSGYNSQNRGDGGDSSTLHSPLPEDLG